MQSTEKKLLDILRKKRHEKKKESIVEIAFVLAFHVNQDAIKTNHMTPQVFPPC